MARRGGRPAGTPTTPGQRSRRPQALNAPFADLGKRVRVPTVPPPRVAPKSVPVDEPNAFASAMEGVVPLGGSRARVDPPRPAGGPRAPVSEEAEALAALSELVNGGAGFDVSDTREYVEGAIVGLDPRLLRRLRRGDFSWQAYRSEEHTSELQSHHDLVCRLLL